MNTDDNETNINSLQTGTRPGSSPCRSAITSTTCYVPELPRRLAIGNPQSQQEHIFTVLRFGRLLQPLLRLCTFLPNKIDTLAAVTSMVSSRLVCQPKLIAMRAQNLRCKYTLGNQICFHGDLFPW